MQLFDAHCHLRDGQLPEPPPDLVGRLCCATCPADWDALAKANSCVAYGVHPGFLGNDLDAVLAALRDRLLADPAAGVGEIGLDGRDGQAPRDRQLAWCRGQYALAVDLHRVASCHCVRAAGALRDLFAEFDALPRGIILHAFPGPAELLGAFAPFGAHFSFGAAILDPRHRRARDAAAAAPADRLLLESDAPDTDPACLPAVCGALADLRGATPEAIAATTTANARRLLEATP